MKNRSKSKQQSAKPVTSKSTGFSNGKKLALGAVGIGLIGVLVWLPTVNMADTPVVTVYKSPTCGCCGKWIDHLEDAGFRVVSRDRQDMNPIKESYGVDYQLRSCHTATVDGYVVEGHVPADDIKRMLREKPQITGIAVPGMPLGSPGMESEHQDPYEVIAFKKGQKNEIYARY